MNLDVVWDWQKQKMGCDLKQNDVEDPTQPESPDTRALMSESMSNPGSIPVHNRNIFKQFAGDHTKAKIPANIALEKRIGLAHNIGQAEGRKARNAGFAAEVRSDSSKPNKHAPPTKKQELEARKKQASAAAAAAKEEAAIQNSLPIGRLEAADGGLNTSAKGSLAPYEGDVFGTRGDYIGGMLYRSRIQAAEQPARANRPASQKKAITAADADADELGSAASDSEQTTQSDTDNSDAEHAESVSDVAFESKQRCAATLRNFSYNDENVVQMASEGAVEALINLASVNDRKTQAYVSTAFRNLAANPKLRKQIAQTERAVEKLVLLPGSGSSTAARDAAIALCHLSNLPGNEAILVGVNTGKDGERRVNAVSVLMQLLVENEELAPICTTTLFNLTCVKEAYPQIERIVKSFIVLSGSNSVETKRTSAKALVNLSNLGGRTCQRCIDEGIVQACVQLSRSSDTETQRFTAVILSNLATVKTCRAELVSKDATRVVVALSQTQDQETHKWCASALNQLAQDKPCRARLVAQGSVQALTSVAQGNDVITSRFCARALQCLSCTAPQVQGKVVENGGVSTIRKILDTTQDGKTKNQCT